MPQQPRVTEVSFKIREDKTLCDVTIDAAGCPGVVSGVRRKEFPATVKLSKLKSYIESFEKSHPKDWK